jgi:hypothetical protein
LLSGTKRQRNMISRTYYIVSILVVTLCSINIGANMIILIKPDPAWQASWLKIMASIVFGIIFALVGWYIKDRE